MRRILSVAVVLASLLAIAAPRASAVPPSFSDELVQGGLSAPTALEILPGGRILVLEKGGTIKVVHADGSVTVAATLSVCAEGEQGLLDAAIDANFAANGFIYVYRTHTGDTTTCGTGRGNQLSRFTMSGDTISVASEVVLVDNLLSSATNHNGGTVQVGHDGYLYVSIGENAVQARAQDLSSLHGKVLRITTAGLPAPGNPYLAAAGHGPCARLGSSAAVCEEIYALGLRNPFRMAFDPNASGVRFFINDVGSGGSSHHEEVNEGLAGANYGWPTREGFCPRSSPTPPCTPDPQYGDPLTAYPGPGTYIVGGAFVPNGWWGAAYDGGYLFADGGSNDMWLLTAAGTVDYAGPFADTNLSVATDLSFGVRNGQRAMFYVNEGNGQLRKIVGPNAATTQAAGPAYLGSTPAPTPVPPIVTNPGSYAYTAYPAAQRVYDTRNGVGTAAGKVPAEQVRTVSLGVPPTAAAALVNITLPNDAGPEDPETAPGFLVAWEPGTPMPATSNANVSGNSVAANGAVLQVDSAGRTNISVSTDLHVIVDVLGYYTEVPGPVSAGRFEALTPARLIDTRGTSGPGNQYTRTDSGNISIVRLPVRGIAGVPATADTVGVTVTAIAPGGDSSGYITAYAGGSTLPATSTVNHGGGFDTRANLALVPIGADGTIELYMVTTADVVVDVAGWLTDAGDPASTSGLLRLTAPTRIADSRSAVGFSTLSPGGTATLEPTGVPSGASALVQNVTFVSRDPGWICATPNPWAGGDVSIQNASAADQDRPALTFTELGTAGAPRLRYCTQESADIIVDVFGWFV